MRFAERNPRHFSGTAYAAKGSIGDATGIDCGVGSLVCICAGSGIGQGRKRWWGERRFERWRWWCWAVGFQQRHRRGRWRGELWHRELWQRRQQRRRREPGLEWYCGREHRWKPQRWSGRRWERWKRGGKGGGVRRKRRGRRAGGER